jgi:multiple sugar transport system ATP-binding protein
MTMGDRIVVMKDGLKQQVGAPLGLYFHPANKFVAGFIGSPAMNFIEADLYSEPAGLFLQAPGFKLKIPEDKAAKLKDYNQKRLIFGIRPEDLPEAPCSVPSETFDVLVEVMEPLGSEVYLDVKAGEDTLIARADPNTKAKPHTKLCLKPAMENMHLFDIRDERALLK